MLLNLNSTAQFYTDCNRCIDLSKSIRNEQVLLIVSNTLARTVLQEIGHCRSIVSIFILCSDCQDQESLNSEYDKLVKRCLDQDSLLTTVSQTINCLEEYRMTFSLFDQEQRSSRDLSKDSPSFLWRQMLLHVLKQMLQDDLSKQDMLNKCRENYSFDTVQLEKIDEFQQHYSREKAIEWYIKDCFLYRLLNRALRTEDIDLLYLFRFFIIDLCAEIECEHKRLKNLTDIPLLYRGQMISTKEFEQLKKSVGKIISMNGFLSTSRDINVACAFASPENIIGGFHSVLFEIKVDPSVKTTVFADISNISQMEQEQEVLFTLNSLFNILSVDLDPKLEVWKIKLITADDDTENVEKYMKSVERGTNFDSPMVYFGRLLLYELNQMDRVEKYFNMLLRSLPSDHPDIASVYNWMGVLYDKKGKGKLASEYYQKAYEIRQKRLPPDHSHIAASLFDFASMAEKKKQFDQALSYYEQALTIDEQNYRGDHEHKAEIMKKIGVVYRKKGSFNTAWRYISDALEMFQRILPPRHPHIAMCLRSIGEIYLDQRDFDKAIDYFHQKFQMDEQCLPSDHYYLLGDLDLIVKTYKMKGDIEMALKFCQQKIDDLKMNLSESHLRVAHTLMTMAKILMDDNPDEALRSYEEALSIFKELFSFDHSTITDCLASMASLYLKYHTPDDRLSCLIKVFDSHRRILPSDHVNITKICKTIALCYQEMNNLSEALRYFQKSLFIFQQNYEPKHKMSLENV
ncbi:unnamed protein product [Adineta steineri]|uniref:ADP ribosyltransferase domain-containing protein n=1 Tax=Adineta steineri TaxID=433720 RepID=A0A815UDR6_9BILA|nr:unnamed protein product [Adineta steineri]